MARLGKDRLSQPVFWPVAASMSYDWLDTAEKREISRFSLFCGIHRARLFLSLFAFIVRPIFGLLRRI